MRLIKRNSNMEILRIVAMFMICIHHCSIYGGIISSELPIGFGRLFLEYSTLGNIGVIIFVLITGYYNVNKEHPFKMKRLLSVLAVILTMAVLAGSVPVLADMPGLIEGAGEGRGLGHEFLRHIRRCRVLIHVIDMSGEERDPAEDYEIINRELKTYDLSLEEKPQIVVANKMDDEYAPEYLDEFRKKYPDLKIFEISAVRHEGIDAVLYAAMEMIEQARENEALLEEEPEETVVYRYEPKRPDFEIVPQGPGRWKVESEKIDRLFDTIDFDKEEEVYQFAHTLTRMGVDDALRNAGVKDGDQVIVGTFIMDFKD